MEKWEQENEKIWAILGEAARIRKEAEERWAADKAEAAKRRQTFDEWWAAEKAETARRRQESDERWAADKAEIARLRQESDERWDKRWKEVCAQMGGMGKSDGMMAEGYFFYSLAETMSFGGVHYDRIQRGMQLKETKFPVRGEYDIFMMNDVSVCIVEAKYRVRKDDIVELREKHVGIFRAAFPTYAGHKIYLGVAGLCFDDYAEKEAKEHGIGILMLKGDALEIQDHGLKAY